MTFPFRLFFQTFRHFSASLSCSELPEMLDPSSLWVEGRINPGQVAGLVPNPLALFNKTI